MSPRRRIVWLAGVAWDDVIGTDRRLVTALGEEDDILWIDPPRSMLSFTPASGEEVAAGVRRFPVPTVPGMTRPGSRVIARARTNAVIRRAVGDTSIDVIVVAHPLARFPRGVGGLRVVYATDDWLAGAPMMGLSREAIERSLSIVLRGTDAIAAVTSTLLSRLGPLTERNLEEVPARILPNGSPEPIPTSGPREPIAGLIGQINERIDLDLLQRVADADVPLRIIGPRVGRGADFARTFDRLLATSGVEWTGRLETAELRHQLSSISVGLTPYTDSPFNRSSFPLKTLEYLSAGIPVVSTDLPASRWLASEHVVVATPERFVDAIVRQLSQPTEPGVEASRRAFAAQHAWSHRAEDFRKLVDSARI